MIRKKKRWSERIMEGQRGGVDSRMRAQMAGLNAGVMWEAVRLS